MSFQNFTNNDSAIRAPTRPQLATDVKGAVIYTGLCRAQLYKDMRAGLLVARKKGARTILLYEDLDRYLKAMPEAKFKPLGKDSLNS
ncbi:helix-turn-helix domain-containing protein [Mesorhizobium sp. CO1-1-11]|uniref:helix-turn-helix domain-containing protein n=1 Tax=Mesorhizobium sp. CO1-1-11 TaxID=2876636 RepID=UPI001CCD55D0|nr:helix-turn-helix domain-containing protein [Mesorhizobium sp. CO1-1-11]MBZ9724874.1 helix-turn-helix domain-containing protein [Mesorhizobium sp. CO1-1-11]